VRDRHHLSDRFGNDSVSASGRLNEGVRVRAPGRTPGLGRYFSHDHFNGAKLINQADFECLVAILISPVPYSHLLQFDPR
jgi:hypothetical protein